VISKLNFAPAGTRSVDLGPEPEAVPVLLFILTSVLISV
jgi:hypothetical protein